MMFNKINLKEQYFCQRTFSNRIKKMSKHNIYNNLYNLIAK